MICCGSSVLNGRPLNYWCLIIQPTRYSVAQTLQAKSVSQISSHLMSSRRHCKPGPAPWSDPVSRDCDQSQRTQRRCNKVRWAEWYECCLKLRSSFNPTLRSQPLNIAHYFCEYWPIFNILSPTEIWGNSLSNYDRDFHLTFTMLLHYLVKFETTNNRPTIACIPNINLFYMKLTKKFKI